MNSDSHIAHDGIVEKIADGNAVISFVQSAGCSSCSIKTSCGMTDSSHKYVTVPLSEQLSEGDKVRIVLSEAQGYRAVAFGYLIPFLIVLVVLITSVAVGLREAFAGIISLTVLIPYFVLLRLLSHKLKNHLSIEVQKQ